MSAVLSPLVAIGRSREDSGPLTLWGCFNLSLKFGKYVTNSSLMKVGVYSWLFTVQSLTNIHCISCIHRTQWHLSDFIKGYTLCIYISWNSVNYTHRGDLGGVGTFWFWLSTCCMSQYLWASIGKLEGRRSILYINLFFVC